MNLIVDMLATFRLTRLVIEDHITDGLRERVKHSAMRSVDSPGVAAKIDTFLSCPWCVSFHVGLGVVAARRFVPRAWGPLATVLALSAATGIIAENA